MDFLVIFKAGEPLVIMNCRSIDNLCEIILKKCFSFSIFKVLLFHPDQIKRKENYGFLAAVTDDKISVTAFAHKHSVIVMQPYTNMSTMGTHF